MEKERKFLTKEEIIEKAKSKRTNVPGMTDGSVISSQALAIIKRLGDFDMEDFVEWWHKSTSCGTLAGGHVLQYLDEKSRSE